LNVADMRVVDVPTPAVYGDEESHIEHSSYILRVSSMLLRNFLWRIRVKYLSDRLHPVALCYVLAVASLTGGSVAGFATLVTGLGRTALVLFGFGLLFVVLAMALDKRSNEHLSSVITATADRQ
ncbi:glycosyltransferase family 2 protein, partial [Halobacteriales archaeon QH_8_67_27]